MTPKYYAFIDGDQKGPFTLDQLIEIGVHPSTYVWSKDMADWERADSVEEIRNRFRNHIENRQFEKTSEPEVAQVAGGGAIAPSSPQGNDRERQERPVRFPLPEMEDEIDIHQPPRVSMTLSILSLLLCFVPTGIAAVYFTYKAQKTWDEATRWKDSGDGNIEDLKRKAHEYERLSKMWLGLTVAFGIIFWTLLFSMQR